MKPSDGDRAKKQRALYLLSAVILAIAVLIFVAPARTPAPLKLMAGVGDLMAAAFVLLAARQIAPRP
jgi:hypothetical protein